MQQYAEVVQNRAGDVLPGMRVTVKNLDGSTATIYSDNTGAPSANPIRTDINGGYNFFGLEGPYLVGAPGAGDKRISLAKSTVLDYPPVDRTGVSNSSAGFVAAAAAFAGKQLRIPAGTYLIGANLSLACDLVFERGAKLVAANGITITISGYITAPDRTQIFDWVGTGAYAIAADRFVNASWFGASATVGFDNKAAIQKAFDSLSAGDVYVTGGTFEVHSNVRVSASRKGLRGAGSHDTLFTKKSLTDTLFTFQPADITTTRSTDILVRDCTFQTTQGDIHSGGAFLLLFGVDRVHVSNVFMSNPYYGIITRSSLNVDLLNIDSLSQGASFQGATAYLFDEDATAAKRQPANVFCTNVRSRGASGAYKIAQGFLIGASDGIWFENCYSGSNAVADWYLLPSNSDSQITGVKINNCWCDPVATSGYGIRMAGATSGLFGMVNISNTHIGGALSGANAINISPGAGTVIFGVTVSDNIMWNWLGNGVIVSDVSGGTTRDITIADNNIWGMGASGGSNILIGGCSSFAVTGNRAGYKTYGASASDAAYGLVVTSTCSEFTATGNNFLGNATGGISDLSAATVKKVISNNLTPETAAVTTIASATTITLPASGDTFFISNTTTITSVTASAPGRTVRLIFLGALTFTDGSNLKLAGNFVTTADDVITLVSDGTNWIETGRSAN